MTPWMELKFDWKVVIGSLIGFLGAALGSVGGVGGGGLFVPMLNLIIGFDEKSSIALSKCMIMGTTASTVWCNLKLKHPTKNLPIIDYDLALLFQPMIMMGISMGVALNVIFANWMVTLLLIILFIATSIRSFLKGIQAWNQETILKAEKQRRRLLSTEGEANRAGDYSSLPSSNTKEIDIMDSVWLKDRWKEVAVLFLVWGIFLALQILQNNSPRCGLWFWIFNALQIPVAFSVTAYEGASLQRRTKQKQQTGHPEDICAAAVEWAMPHLILSATSGVIAGMIGGLLGLGGGFIMGPVFLGLGVVPQVSSATATFVMLFSSSMSVVEYYFLHRFPVPYALYLIFVSVLAGFWGQYVVRRLVLLLGRTSLIIFILSGVIFASALTMDARKEGIYGFSQPMQSTVKLKAGGGCG
eukprot:Gb_05099 [translate_table: standard]